MGVINLGVLVKKIMGKIAIAGYVKDTDYASSTKGGTIKTDSTYATDITDAGKLKSKTITAEGYESANASAFVSKGTLDNLITSGAIGGGMTWTKIFDDSAAASSVKTFAEGVDALSHKLILFCWRTTQESAIVPVLGEIIPTATTSIIVSCVRSSSTCNATLTRTGFTMPSNMNAEHIIIYVLD